MNLWCQESASPNPVKPLISTVLLEAMSDAALSALITLDRNLSQPTRSWFVNFAPVVASTQYRRGRLNRGAFHRTWNKVCGHAAISCKALNALSNTRGSYLPL